MNRRVCMGLAGLALLAALLPACANPRTPKHVTVAFDGQTVAYTTFAVTVRGVLTELHIELGSDDRVEPDLWEEILDGGSIKITRVQIREEMQTRQVPFQQKVVKSEALGAGTRKLLQLGSVGREEITYRITIEDGVEAGREELQRKILEPAIDEIVAVGVESSLPSIPISGTLVYLSNGNVWLMRGSSGSRRPLTTSGDLDGRVLALSPNGNWVICSRAEPRDAGALNSLWIVDTIVLNQEPQPLGIQGVIYAEWLRDSRSIVYSTAERISGAPGWKAHNDLWKAELEGLKPAGERAGGESISARSTALLPAAPDELYGWWGTNWALSPDSLRIAYGRPDAVGVFALDSQADTRLLRFAAYHTYGEWVWLPEMSWSPDGQFLVASVHGPARPGEKPEDSRVFDVQIVDLSGQRAYRMVAEAGMWAAPAWGPFDLSQPARPESAIAYGQARLPLDSQNSRYDLYVMDRDGSNRRKVFPPEGWEGLVAPDRAWSPDGRQLVLSYEGNLYLIDSQTRQWRQLTEDGHSVQPRWSE